MTYKAPFRDRRDYTPSSDYRLSPFRFGQLDASTYIVTNDVGEYVLLTRAELDAFVNRHLTPDSATYRKLKARHFVFDETSRVALDLLALKYRSRAERLASFTGLHMFVVTLRCDHSCHYCQVSRQTEDKTSYDMSRAHADKALALTFRSPSPNIKIEFQGGEPLLNFELVSYIVERALQMNQSYGRDLQFVIATNLSRLSDDVLTFCKTHRIFLSTSLDGPADLHDSQRPLKDASSHAKTVEGMRKAWEVLGPDSVSALMTTTTASLNRVEEIVDEYARLGLRSIFLRHRSPFGFAARNSLVRRYTVDDWVEFYKRGLAHVLATNHRGYVMREEFTSILLQKMFSPTGAAFVDLQSPAGIGIAGIIYNYDGAVYASDEGRMLAEMGDQTFRLGHVDHDEYETMMASEGFLGLLNDTMLEGVPMCNECPFLPYCGADPVFHKATLRDPIGHKAFSSFCARQMAVVRHVITLLETDSSARDLLRDWI